MRRLGLDPFAVALLSGFAVAVAFLAAVAVVAPMLFGGDRSHRSNGVHVSATSEGTVIHDPWCQSSEDSCIVNFRPSGVWVLRRVTP